MVHYVITRREVLSFLDYMDFMRKARWKTYGWRKRKVIYANYLDICTLDQFRSDQYSDAHNAGRLESMERQAAAMKKCAC
jgi:hypothetical protein